MYARNMSKTLLLYLAGSDDPLTDDFAGLSRPCLGEFFKGDRNNFYLYINTVQQRT